MTDTMTEVTYKVYWNEVFSLAESLLEETVEEHGGEPEEAFDYVHNAVDSHQWVIYNAYHFPVLWHCENRDAYFDTMGECPTGDSFGELTMKLAYAALCYDVESALREMVDNYEKKE